MKNRITAPVMTIFWVGSLLFLASPALVKLMNTERAVNIAGAQAQREARNSSAFAVMMGEFRTNVGDMLFVKTERYLDSGIGYAPHINERQMSKTGETDGGTTTGEVAFDSSLASNEIKKSLAIKPGSVQTHPSNGEKDHEHEHATEHGHSHETNATQDGSTSVVKTLISSANTDFRGFIGDLERKVKPWRDPSAPHQHTAGTELLPWYRLATLSDPHNVRNYMIGAWWLKSLRTPEQRQEALKFLSEGTAANPEAYELYLMQGYILREMGKLTSAQEKFKKSADLALKSRPPGGPDSTPDWDTTDDEQMAAAMTMDVMMTRDLQSTSSAILVTKKYIQRIPTEGSLKRMLGELENGN